MIYPEIKKYIENLKPLMINISDERRLVLKKISEFIASKMEKNENAKLIFICTHNSRRSHFGQIWAQTIGEYYNLKHIRSYSGGTEATAFNPNAMKAVEAAGFKVVPTQNHVDPNNPIMEIHFGDGLKVLAFSKKYNDEPNPKQDFCAIMTCNDADENCPIIQGAELRVSTPYQDPKKFDNTPQQEEKYAERCEQIAAEIMYIFSKI